jgi:Leucine-rich repeat (LRR) protein
MSGELGSKFQKAKALTSLNLASNAFNDVLPASLFGLPLEELDLGTNLFTGTIPGEIQQATSLTSLTLGPNRFSGDVPAELGSLTSLERLSIRQIPDLGGRLLASYGLTLTNLVELIITQTNIRGDVPDLFGQMTNLEMLDLSSNSLRGDLPTELGLLTNLSKCSGSSRLNMLHFPLLTIVPLIRKTAPRR